MTWTFAKRMAKADDLANYKFSPWSVFAQELLYFTISVVDVGLYFQDMA